MAKAGFEQIVYNNLHKQSIVPELYNTTVTGAWVDLTGYDDFCFLIEVGTVGSQDGTHALTFEYEENGASGNIPIPAASLIQTATPAPVSLVTATAAGIYRIGLRRTGTEPTAKWRVRAISTVSAGSVGMVYGVAVELGAAHRSPVASS